MSNKIDDCTVTGEVIMSEWNVTDCHTLLLNVSHRTKTEADLLNDDYE